MHFLLVSICLWFVGAAAWKVPLPSSVLHGGAHPRSISRVRTKMTKWGSPKENSDDTRVYSIIAYGGDPSGSVDATNATTAAMAALLASCSPSGDSTLTYVLNCGGATLDLEGGQYLISQPISIPPNYGNLRIWQGTLRASASFPSDRFLIEVGNTTVGGGGNCIDIDLSGLFLDAYQVAAGSIYTNNVQGGVIGPQVYVFNFTQFGMMLNNGFELTVMQSWAGEYWWTNPKKENGTASTAVGIAKNGNDGDVIDLVIFSSKIGLVLNGEANFVSAVHTWNLANGNGGIGILVNRSQLRLDDCYLDWTDVVFASPSRVSFTNGIFLCGARIRLEAPPTGVASGVYIANNEYIAEYCHFSNYSGVQADGAFTSVSDVTVVGTNAEPVVSVKSTAATLVASSGGALSSTFTADFTDRLLFDVASVPIQTVQFSLTVGGGGPVVAAVARPPVLGVITIETAQPVNGTVVISVDQSKRTGP